MTPLPEQKSLNLHDETTACDQVPHSLFRAVVGKVQNITVVRLDLVPQHNAKWVCRTTSSSVAELLVDATSQCVTVDVLRRVLHNNSTSV